VAKHVLKTSEGWQMFLQGGLVHTWKDQGLQ